MSTSPLSPDDLRTLADSIEQLRLALIDEDGNYTAVGALVLRLEVTRPDTDDPIGHFTLQDGWIGFTPIGWTRS